MEIIPLHYGAQVGLYDENEEAHGRTATDYAGQDYDECYDRCEQECGEEAWRIACCSRVGKIAILVMSVVVIYLIISALTPTESTRILDANEPRQGINVTRAQQVLNSLCDAYERGDVSGDSCNRLCFNRNWLVTDYYEGHKTVVIVKDGGQTAVYKTTRPFIDMFDPPPPNSDAHFSDAVVDAVNDELRLGWPKHYSRHLIETVWPTMVRTKGESMSRADRRSLWALLTQPEFILFRVLPLTRVTPKLIGTCGHMYQTESLVAFKMKGYYTNLKAKILVHVMGTLKLLYEFLDEPLQWCDVRFDNLGLSADYPKRFVLMDGDMVYTKSKLDSLLRGRPCETDDDCKIGDCTARCTSDMVCSSRSNGNLEKYSFGTIIKTFEAPSTSASNRRFEREPPFSWSSSHTVGMRRLERADNRPVKEKQKWRRSWNIVVAKVIAGEDDLTSFWKHVEKYNLRQDVDWRNHATLEQMLDFKSRLCLSYGEVAKIKSMMTSKVRSFRGLVQNSRKT